MTENSRDKMNAVFIKYGLNKEDHIESYGAGETKFTLINRDGIMLIKNALDIEIDYELVHTNGKDEAVIKATTILKRKNYQTFGEVNPLNNTFAHPVNVAEKRAMSRIVLECVNLYEADFLGSDEFHGNPLAEKAIPKRKRKPPVRDLGADKLEEVIAKSEKATPAAKKKPPVKKPAAKKVEGGPAKFKAPAKRTGKEIAIDMLAVKHIGSTR